MSFLDDIRKQSKETRDVMFYLSVFITVLLIGMVWFRSFQKNLYALMNPEEDVKKMLAIENTPVPSLFSFIGQSANEARGLILDFFSKEKAVIDNKQTSESSKTENSKAYILPLSEYK